MFGVIFNTKNIISLNNMVLTINKIFNRNKLDIFFLEKKNNSCILYSKKSDCLNNCIKYDFKINKMNYLNCIL